MNHFWAKLFKKQNYSDLLDKAVKEAVNQERLWFQDQLKNTNIANYNDNFYIMQESYSAEDKKWAETYYHSGKKDEVNQAKLVNLIASTGWSPSGLEEAAFRVGSSDELSTIQDACFKKYLIDPIGKSIVKNFEYYVIGKGVKVSSPVQEINDYLMKFRKVNQLPIREKKMVRSAFIEGEYFLKYIVIDGMVYLRKVKPSKIKEIKTADDDMEQILAFEVARNSGDPITIKSIEADQYIENFNSTLSSKNNLRSGTYIQFIKIGEEEYLRGSPPMYSALRYIKYYEDWIIDRLRLNHERSKVVWIKSTTGDKRQTQFNPFSAPKGGIMLHEDNNIKYRIESAKLDAADAKEDGLSILYLIGSAMNMPINVLNQRVSETVYASLKKSDSPFSQMIEDSQEFWRFEWEKMYRFALKASGQFNNKKFKVPEFQEGIKSKLLKVINEMVLESKTSEEIINEAKNITNQSKTYIREYTIDDVPINQVYPQVVQENQLELAKVLLMHSKMGIVSDQTASERAGYDWHHELMRGLRQKDEIVVDKNGEPNDGKIKS